MTSWLVVSVLAAPAFAAPSSEASFFTAVAGARESMSAGFKAASWNEVDTLIDLLRDRDPEVRRQAVRSLKAWVAQRSSTRDRVLDVYKSSSEDVAVRREAAKTLSVVSGNSDIYQALLDYARRGSDRSLRAISYKALYWSAAQRSDVRDDVLDAARRESDPVVRLAAIWALFGVNDNRVKDALLDIARRDSSEAARVEALKSLYGMMGYNDVRDAAYDFARDARTPAALREAAILLHSNRVTSSQKDLLLDIAARDADPVMRRAAIVALGSPRAEDIWTYFHLVRRDQNGVMAADPLDAQ
ncbi:MAG: HEAT repeat domain-containing protein [Elusimicrobiota bacterium]|nr:HEAT repeat domain-containing protein [Elusimicrobiota bacterium]